MTEGDFWEVLLVRAGWFRPITAVGLDRLIGCSAAIATRREQCSVWSLSARKPTFGQAVLCPPTGGSADVNSAPRRLDDRPRFEFSKYVKKAKA